MVLKQKLIVPILILTFFIQGVYGTDISISTGGSADDFAGSTRYAAGNNADISSTVALDPVNGNSQIQSTITGTDDANLKWSVDKGNSHAEAGFNLKSNGGTYSFKHNQGFLSGGLVYADLTLDARGISNVIAGSYANTKFTDATTNEPREMIARATIQVEDSTDNPNSVNIAGYYTKAVAGPDYVSAHQEIMGRPSTAFGNTNTNSQYRIAPKITGNRITISTYAERPHSADLLEGMHSGITAEGDGSKFTAYNADAYSSRDNGGYISVNSIKAESPNGDIHQSIGKNALSIDWGDVYDCMTGVEVSRGYIDSYQARTDTDADGVVTVTKQDLIKVNGNWNVYAGAYCFDAWFDEKSGSGPTILKSKVGLPISSYSEHLP
jgi:hypothetical protein